ncbi:adenine nucleotide alpha hydrolase family protein [Flavobacterium flavipallidum]|uniref:7-cyano-7-deazaguanine synthase n=1 Tax=Flavobacterium flavipallidum TaxID=3139140 RepID=A0ABU9HP83_9FLAO
MAASNLLWTGGWDSTFRLLQIIFIEKKTVQPIYILDKNRKSLNKELETIENISNKIQSLDQEAYSRILPVRYINKDSNICEEIKNSSLIIKALTKMGSQHEWISQYCHTHNLKNIEMSIEKNENPQSFTQFLVKNYININPVNPTNKELYNNLNTVFKYYSFPLIDISKKEMIMVIKKNVHWEEIMNLTWFCHKPKKNKACGQCVPCITVIKKGLGFRIPKINRIKGRFKILLNK